jgi:hypothetical protein
MRVGQGDLLYEWVDDWGVIDDTPATLLAWPHAGMVAADGEVIVTFHPSEAALLVFDPDGTLVSTAPCPVSEAHGITVVIENGAPALWLADASMKATPEAAYRSPAQTDGSAVVKVSIGGLELGRLDRPPSRLYPTGDYRPTCVAVNETRWGGNGDVWVADGYGENLVHRMTADGAYVQTLTGEEGAGRFDQPHAIFVDRRRDEPELYVADRVNARIQVYDLDGRFKRVVGDDVLNRPTWLATDGDLLFVVEFLPPRLTVLDGDDRLVAYLLEDRDAPSRPGWPNELDGTGRPVRTTTPRPGRLNSPHAIAIDHHSNLYLTEWLIGGRRIKLTKLSA